jgi:iron complex outermembrane receptor protein
MKLSALLAGTCTFAFCAAIPVHAQDMDAAKAGAEESNVIIVTATRRAESLQDLPVAVTALSGEALDNVGVFSVEILASVAPSITFTQSTND